MPRYKPMRQKRINRLRESGFTQKEAVGLTGLKQNGRPVVVLNRKVVKDMMRARRKQIIVDLAFYTQDLLDVARDTDTTEAWAIFRYYHRMAIDSGAIEETPRKYDPNKPHKKLTAEGQIDRDHVNLKKREYRERQKSRRY